MKALAGALLLLGATSVACAPTLGRAQQFMDGSENVLSPPERTSFIGVLGQTLRELDSAQIRDIRMNSDRTFCGQINGKNGFGGYTGFRPMIVFPYEGRTSVYFFDPQPPRLTTREELEVAKRNLAGLQLFAKHCAKS